MSSLGIAGMIALLCAVGLGLLSLDKIVKTAFASWVLMGLSVAIGAGIRGFSEFLNLSPELVFLGVRYERIAHFLITAQPTIMLVMSGLLMRFFIVYGQLSLQSAEDLFHKIIWAVLAVGSVLSMVRVSLFIVGGGLYEWLFMQWDLGQYVGWFPLFVVMTSILVLFFASKVNIKLSFNASISE